MQKLMRSGTLLGGGAPIYFLLNESANQSVQSLVNEKSEETIVSTPFPDIQVKLEKSVWNSRTEVYMLQSRCRAAALASFEAFTSWNNRKMEPEKDLDLRIADASEKILTFEKTLELTENHLSNLERKVQAGIQMLTKTLGKYNDQAQQTKNIQKYQTDQLDQLQVKPMLPQL